MAQDIKSRFWVGILWVDSMVDNWKDNLDVTLQMPYTYIVHDKDINGHGDPKPPHIHIMVAYSNTTTEKNIRSIFNSFSKPGNQCCNKVYRVIGVKYMDDYFLHITKEAKKQGKHIYSEFERIRGLGWDTSVFNQEAQLDKLKMIMQLGDDIKKFNIQTYIDLYSHIVQYKDLSYLDLLISYSGHFERMVKGQWQRNCHNDE